jgi:hypothetical protein
MTEGRLGALLNTSQAITATSSMLCHNHAYESRNNLCLPLLPALLMAEVTAVIVDRLNKRHGTSDSDRSGHKHAVATLTPGTVVPHQKREIVDEIKKHLLPEAAKKNCSLFPVRDSNPCHPREKRIY